MRRLPLLPAGGRLGPGLPAKELLEIKGDYLLYSYDFNYIYGQGSIQLQGQELDHPGRHGGDRRGRPRRPWPAAAAGSRPASKKYAADLLEIDLESLALKFTSFKESIRSWTLPGAREPPPRPRAARRKRSPGRTWRR